MFDKSVVLAVCAKLSASAVKVEKAHQVIIGEMVSQMQDLPHASRIEMIAEAVKSFPKEAKKAGGQGYSQYQYASRLKSIVGAAFLIKDFKVEGSVNGMYSAATKALKAAKIDALGNNIEAAQQAEAAKARVTAEALELHKLSSNAKSGTSIDDLKAEAAANVDKAMADAMLTKVQTAAETYAVKMIEAQGYDAAEAYAVALLAAVRGTKALKLAA